MRRPMYVLWMVLIAATGLVSSCGSEGDLVPSIDTVAPNPPLGVHAIQNGYEVLVAWNENAEADLAGYRLYASSYEDGPFGLVVPRLLLCSWCHDAVAQQQVTYYKVTAVDQSGNESAYSQIVGIYMGPRNNKSTNSKLEE